MSAERLSKRISHVHVNVFCTVNHMHKEHATCRVGLYCQFIEHASLWCTIIKHMTVTAAGYVAHQTQQVGLLPLTQNASHYTSGNLKHIHTWL